jgi:adenylate cyclase
MPRIRQLRTVESLSTLGVRHGGWLAHVVLSLLLAFIGWFAVQWRELVWPRFGDEVVDWQEMGMDPFQRLSFDLPFIIRHSLPDTLRPLAGPPRPTSEVVILYMDDESFARLGQPPGGPWSRAMHAKLLNWLIKDGARAVTFDVIFDQESSDDGVFAAALTQHGNVFLGATINASSDVPLAPDEMQRFLQVGLATEQLTKRAKTLYQAARGWGLLTFRPVDADYCVRRLYVGKRRDGLESWPTATWQLAQALGANLPEEPEARFARRWINYYGPARRIESISYHRALVQDGGVPPGYFKDKVVFIGARSQLGSGPKKLLDEFSTPWSRFRGRTYTPGAEIHATIFLNLVHRDWLERVPASTEKWIVVLLGLALGALRWLRPWRAVIVTCLAVTAIFAVTCLLQWRSHLWWNWTIPVFVQIPLGLFLAVTSRYYLEERRKRKLRQAFGYYLSPALATQIAEREFSLAPGGEKVVATMMFTDLEGFTELSERLGDSARLGQVLRYYFTRTTDLIFAEKGTVIKFIGDAVFAAWGAPLPQADQAERAVRAAWQISKVAEMDVPSAGPNGTSGVQPVHTRIGIHTGEALAGNLGSERRFDYTLIGDAVNLASRLEGVNKYLGTTVLLSDETAKLLNGKFLLRRVGLFKVKGRANSIVFHELLGDDPAAFPQWLATYDAALAAWMAGDFTAARDAFDLAVAERDGMDGPSLFYLNLLDKISTAPPDWNGEITLEQK